MLSIKNTPSLWIIFWIYKAFFNRIYRIAGTWAGGDSGGAFLQENMGWDSQAVVKRSDHAEAEWAFVIENF
jgi:hypothetical protein